MHIPVPNSQVCLRMRWFYFLAIQQAALCLEKHNNGLYMLFTIRELFNTFTAGLVFAQRSFVIVMYCIVTIMSNVLTVKVLVLEILQ